MKIYLKNLRNDATVEWRGEGGGGSGAKIERKTVRKTQKTSYKWNLETQFLIG